MKGTVVVDFDGVLNSYASGWTKAGEIPDGPVEGAQRFLLDLKHAGYEVVICSTRAAEPEGRAAISEWLLRHQFPLDLKVQHGKPPALVYLDDRALRFEGPPWPTIQQVDQAARPWYRR